MMPNCGSNTEMCDVCAECCSLSTKRFKAIENRLLREKMNDCVFYPPPSRESIRGACALKTTLIPSDEDSTAHFPDDVADVIVRFIYPRVPVQHLRFPHHPEITIATDSLSGSGWVPTQLLSDYVQRVRNNNRTAAYNQDGFEILERSQYTTEVADKRLICAQAKRQRERKERGLSRREEEEKLAGEDRFSKIQKNENTHDGI
jgi:hypothetical protein